MQTISTSIAALALCVSASVVDAAIIHRDIAARNVLIIRASQTDRPSVTGTGEADYGDFGVDITVEPAVGRWAGAYSDGTNPSAALKSNPLYSGDESETNPLFDEAAIFTATIGAISGSAIQIDTGTAFSNTMGSAFQFDWTLEGQTYTFVIPAIEAWAVLTQGPWINQPTEWTLGSDLPLTPVGLALELNTSVTLVAGSTLSLTPVPTPGVAVLGMTGAGMGYARRRRAR